MRTNQRIYFVEQGKEEFDPELGENVRPEAKKEPYPCFVTDLGITKSIELFGDMDKKRKVVRFRNLPNKTYDYIEYEGDKYKVKQETLNGLVLYIERDEIG